MKTSRPVGLFLTDAAIETSTGRTDPGNGACSFRGAASLDTNQPAIGRSRAGSSTNTRFLRVSQARISGDPAAMPFAESTKDCR